VKKLLPIAHTLEGLAAGELRSSDLVESCLNAIADPTGEGARTFTRVFSDSARSKAKEFDTHRTAGALAGLPISVKALFDVAGEPTTAGSVVLAQAPVAKADAVGRGQAARSRRDRDGAYEYDGVCFLWPGSQPALWHAV
jgi:aspartyl-tRNA(Asn)/glutamyl-tRNA(Gln) amidotransferase subunit A